VKIDVTEQISAVRRTVGTRALEAGEAHVVTISQSYASTVEDVWDACTNPERIPRWLMPISGDLRLGGRYQLEGNAGGTIETCDPPNAFSATWEYGGGMSWIEVALTAEGDRTRVTIEHIAHVEDALWQQFGPGAVGIGWDMMILGLALHLPSGAANDPAEAAAWMASPEGVEFMTRSNDAWCEAHVASGEDAATARERAGRTLAAYTGAPAD
jgi:uncharacterized protein YndB with AHSA1/START domain